jgi:hypothetical protein
VAAGIHGSARATIDLDLCYDPAPDNVERLATLLRDWRAYPRGVQPGMPFFMDEKAFRTTPVMNLTTDLGAIDLMEKVAGIGGFRAVLANSVEVEVQGASFRALSIAGIVKAKRAAGRPRDREQLPELEALLAITRQKAKADSVAAEPDVKL